MDGETGDAFVDANMQELKLTGFMSSRGRQNVASYLVHKLGQDWRVGAAWFEVHAHRLRRGQQLWRGVGFTPPAWATTPVIEVFNTKRQEADMYDKNGEYRAPVAGK